MICVVMTWTAVHCAHVWLVCNGGLQIQVQLRLHTARPPFRVPTKGAAMLVVVNINHFCLIQHGRIINDLTEQKAISEIAFARQTQRLQLGPLVKGKVDLERRAKHSVYIWKLSVSVLARV